MDKGCEKVPQAENADLESLRGLAQPLSGD